MRDVKTVRAARRASGFSLIEMMIAMLLGLVVVAGVTSVFLANMSSYNANQGLSEIEEGGRTAFELMSRDMRQAGLTGCNETESVVNVLNNGTTLWYADWNNSSGNGGPLRGFEAGVDDPAVVSGTTSGNRNNAYASLHMLGASASALSMSADDQNAATFTLNETTATVPLGTIMIVCNPDHAAITQITGQSGAVLTHATGGSLIPGNCVKGLGMPNGCVGNQVDYQVNAMLAPLQAVDWYIGPNSANTQSLWRLAPAPDPSTGNIVTNQPSEIVRNVSSFTITYLLSGGTQYVDATTVAGNWGNVVAIQVDMKVQSTNTRAGVDAQPLTREFVSTTTLRNRVN